MALPNSRNTTYVASVSEVKAADLNDIQDKIVDAYRPTIIKNIAPAASGYATTGNPYNIPTIGGAVGSDSAAPESWYVVLATSEGETIDSVIVACTEAGTATEEITLRLYEDVLGVTQQIADTIITGVSGGAASYTWDDTTNDTAAEMPYTVPVDGRLILVIDFAQTSLPEEAQVLNAKVTSH